MPPILHPDELIRRRVETRTNDPQLQDLLIKLIKNNPDLEDLFLNYDLDKLKDLSKLQSGSPSSSVSSPVQTRPSYRSDFSSGSPSSTSSSPIGSGSSGSCFIATAAYGSPLAKDVLVLSSFRDQYLQRSSFGRAFIKVYYNRSPRIARFISNKPGLKKVFRLIIMPVVVFCKNLDR